MERMEYNIKNVQNEQDTCLILKRGQIYLENFILGLERSNLLTKLYIRIQK